MGKVRLGQCTQPRNGPASTPRRDADAMQTGADTWNGKRNVHAGKVGFATGKKPCRIRHCPALLRTMQVNSHAGHSINAPTSEVFASALDRAGCSTLSGLSSLGDCVPRAALVPRLPWAFYSRPVGPPTSFTRPPRTSRSLFNGRPLRLNRSLGFESDAGRREPNFLRRF